MAAIRSWTTHSNITFLLKLFTKCFRSNFSWFNIRCWWNFIFIKCHEESKCINMSTLSCNSLDFISFDKIGKEIILHYITIDVNLIARFRNVSDKLGCFIVQTGPEEGSNPERNKFIKHVIRCVWSLVLSIWPMFDANLFASVPVWERTNITSSINVFHRCL